MYDPTGVIIDGAVPRNDRERVDRLCDYAESIIAEMPPRSDKKGATEKITELRAQGRDIKQDFVYEVEDDVISEIVQLLDALELGEFEIELGEGNPGDVIVRMREED